MGTHPFILEVSGHQGRRVHIILFSMVGDIWERIHSSSRLGIRAHWVGGTRSFILEVRGHQGMGALIISFSSFSMVGEIRGMEITLFHL